MDFGKTTPSLCLCCVSGPTPLNSLLPHHFPQHHLVTFLSFPWTLGFYKAESQSFISLSLIFFLGGPNCTEYGTLVLRLEMEAVHPAVESRVLLTTGPPGKSLNPLFHLRLPTEHTGGTDESRTSFLCVQWWLSLFNHPVTFDSL